MKEIKPFIQISTHAFEIFSRLKPTESTSNESTSNQYLVSVAPGSINNLLPTNIISPQGVLQDFTINKDEINYVKLKFQSNGQIINKADIIVDNKNCVLQIPVPFGLPTEAEILLGVVYNSVTYQLIFSNLFLGAKVQYILKADKPDALPFVPYLIWG